MEIELLKVELLLFGKQMLEIYFIVVGVLSVVNDYLNNSTRLCVVSV